MKYLFLLSTILLFSNVFAQFGSISSQYCIGSTSTDIPVKEALLDNGNRIVLFISNSPAAGVKTENCRGDYDFWVLCLDPNNQIVWQKTIGGTDQDYPSSILITEDQSIYVCGMTLSPQSFEQSNVLFGSWDAWLIKMNSAGDILWDKIYGGSASDSFNDLVELPSGNLLVFGSSASGMTGNKTSSNFGGSDIWCLTLSSNGNVLSDKSIGGSGSDLRPYCIQTALNRIKLVANSWSDVSGLKTEPSFGYTDIWVLDLDTNCNIIQQKTIGGSDRDKPNDLMWSSDGKLLILAESWSNQSGLKSEDSYGLMDTWILKLDTDLNIIEQKTVGSNFEEYGGQFIETPNGNICVAVNSNSNPNQYMSTSSLGSFDIWIYALDANFNFLADKTINTPQDEQLSSLRLSSNLSTIELVVGSEASDSFDKNCPSSGAFDLWGLSLQSTLEAIDIQSLSSIKVYPNPTSDFITIEIADTEQIQAIELLELSGKSIKTLEPNSKTFLLTDLSPGIYLLRITTEKGNFCDKIYLE